MNFMLVCLALIGLCIIGSIYLVSTRNKFVVLRNRVNDQGSQIDVQLKRRFDLIPNLVAVVKGAATFEQGALEKVIAARAVGLQARDLSDRVQADNVLSNAIGKLMAVAERYPELKANTNFLQLQQELGATENKIAHTRQFYNDTVLRYNNAIEMFPGNIVASMCGFAAKEYFAIAADDRENPNIGEFSIGG